jgi:hypothetical protein
VYLRIYLGLAEKVEFEQVMRSKQESKRARELLKFLGD